MALIEAAYSADSSVFNIRAAQAGNPDEMVVALNAQLAAAVANGEANLVDFYLSGTGAGPNWEACFVTGTSEETLQIPLDEAKFIAVEASNSIEVALRLNQALAALSPAPTAVFKVQIAGGGIGTIFMAIALILPGGG